VLANRLSADPSVQVALIEAGPRDRSLNIRIPPAFPRLFHAKYDWAVDHVAARTQGPDEVRGFDMVGQRPPIMSMSRRPG
jgi:choline dehydrogenase-like flavoprotein